MPLSVEQEPVIRQWLGSGPTTDSIDDMYALVGSWDAVVITMLRQQIADAAAQPASFSVPGLSISYGQQVEYLRSVLKDFYAAGGTGLDETSSVGVEIGHLVRPRRR